MQIEVLDAIEKDAGFFKKCRDDTTLKNQQDPGPHVEYR